MTWSFVLTHLMLNGKAGGSILIDRWRCVHAQSFCLGFFKRTYRFRLLQRKKCRFQFYESTPNWFVVSIKIYCTPRHFCLDFKLGPWYGFILWHPPSPFFFLTPCGQKFLASTSLGCFLGEERRLQNPRSVGNFLLGRRWWPKHLCWWNRKIGANGTAECYCMGCFVFLVWQIVVQQNWKYLPCA